MSDKKMIYLPWNTSAARLREAEKARAALEAVKRTEDRVQRRGVGGIFFEREDAEFDLLKMLLTFIEKFAEQRGIERGIEDEQAVGGIVWRCGTARGCGCDGGGSGRVWSRVFGCGEGIEFGIFGERAVGSFQPRDPRFYARDRPTNGTFA